MENVVRFPPLPPLPAPPEGPLDPRQQTYYRVSSNLVMQLCPQEQFESTDTIRGFRASAVDLGRLQELLEDAIRLMDMQDLRERWDQDLGEWFRRVTVSWIQRCKCAHFDLANNGIHISVETQDDRGYYQYEFEVFPGRKR